MLVYFATWKGDPRNTGTTAGRKLISYPSQAYLHFERGGLSGYRLNVKA